MEAPVSARVAHVSPLGSGERLRAGGHTRNVASAATGLCALWPEGRPGPVLSGPRAERGFHIFKQMKKRK